MNTDINSQLRDFHRRWRFDIIRIGCRFCHAGMLARDRHIPLKHKHSCHNSHMEFPWAALGEILVPGGVPAEPSAGRVYLAGPMSGHPDLNFPLFHGEAGKLRRAGFFVINPAEINEGLSQEWSDCMRVDIRALTTCGAIALLPGWEKSPGATLEHDIAARLGMRVATVAELLEIDE